LNMKRALLVIDVQGFFMAKSPKDLPQKILDYIKSSDYDYLAFTYSKNFPGSNWQKFLNSNRFIDGEDIQLAKELKAIATKENTYEKHTYSAIKQTKLGKALRDNKIQEIDICGIDLDACVLATAYDAFDSGYKVKVLFHLSHSRNLNEASRPVIDRYIHGIRKEFETKNIELKQAKLFTDGGSRGNPGPSAIAFVICKMDNNVVEKSGEYIGSTTNNQAEYQALKMGLKRAQQLGITKLIVSMDSELIVKQINGLYKIKNAELLPHYNEIKQLAGQFEQITFQHVPRALNAEADAEVNRILDEKNIKP
jgi:ribonuclease HI